MLKIAVFILSITLGCAPKQREDQRSDHLKDRAQLSRTSSSNGTGLHAWSDELQSLREELLSYKESKAYQQPDSPEEWEYKGLIDALWALDEDTLKFAIDEGIWTDFMGATSTLNNAIDAVQAASDAELDGLALTEPGEDSPAEKDEIESKTSTGDLAEGSQEKDTKNKVIKGGALVFLAATVSLVATHFVLEAVMSGTPEHLRGDPTIKERWAQLSRSAKVEMVARLGLGLAALGLAGYVLTLDSEEEIGTNLTIALGSLLGIVAVMPLVTAVRTIVQAESTVDRALREIVVKAVERDSSIGLKGDAARKHADELIAKAKANPLSKASRKDAEQILAVSNTGRAGSLEERLRAVYNHENFESYVKKYRKSAGFKFSYGNLVSWGIAASSATGSAAVFYGGLSLADDGGILPHVSRLVEAVQQKPNENNLGESSPVQ